MYRILISLLFCAAVLAPVARAETPPVAAPVTAVTSTDLAASPPPAPVPVTPATGPITLTVAGKNVVLTLPEGTCAYDKSQAVDARVLGFLEKGNEGMNQVLLAFSDCGDLAAMRQGKPSTRGYYGQVLSEYAKQPVADSYSRPAYVKEMTGEFDAASEQEGVKTAADRAKNVLNERVDPGDVKMLGVINKDTDFVQSGMIQSVPLADGTAQKIDGVVTITKLGVPVSINLYHVDATPATWAELNTQAVNYAKKLISLNADSYIPHADERGEDNNRVIVYAIAAGAVVMLTLIALLLHRRKRAAP